jgi:hypothetical protein
VLRGLRVERVDGAEGPVRLVRASSQVGDVTKARGTLFLCPYMGRRYALFSLARGAHGPVVENADPFEPHLEEYDAFVARVIAAAQKLVRSRSGARRPSAAPGAPQPLRR